MNRARIRCVELHARGPILKVRLGLQAEDAKDLPNPPPFRECNALLDTGARGSCVKTRTAELFGIDPSDERLMRGINTREERHDVYDFRLAILNESAQPIWEGDIQLIGVDQMANPRYNIIIGRDILGLGTLVYYGKLEQIRLQFRR